ncbi:CoA-acylating methylmalonate-semialdehyde dehydrogenase [Dehalococcoidia bacterium]|nr:CoA-acylating methylmalonate-semialdehyde dehydrogenase [Dehalococcoidia bacterium]
MPVKGRLLNYVNGEWQPSSTAEYLDVTNPATGEIIAEVPLSTKTDVDEAVQSAAKAFPGWRRTPAVDRVQHLFKLKHLLDKHFEELAALITKDCGKTLAESRGELRRAIENVEVACGIPTMMQGYNSEDVSHGIDEFMVRQPLGVVAAVTPFNFPAMIPFWFMPYAIACGNTFLLKPSEKAPTTMQRVFEIMEQINLPPGVVGLVNGANDSVDAILDHDDVKAISFVGTTAVAKYIYSRAAENGKRMQCQGGAKNPVVVLPDAEPEATAEAVAASAFDCGGQRCLAASLAITVGAAHSPFAEAMADTARARRVGYGLVDGTEMGPVITADSKTRIEGLIQTGVDEGATALVDGRGTKIPEYPSGYFVKPTVLDGLDLNGEVVKSEIFGPVLGLLHVDRIDDAIDLINSGRYGNMACIFTRSGASARKFRYEVDAGNIGINLGVAAPMAFYPFSGWKQSFFGILHGQGRDAIEFYTEKKVVIERWD